MLRRLLAPAKWRKQEVNTESDVLLLSKLLAFNPKIEAATLMGRFGRACCNLAGVFAIRQALFPESHTAG